MNYRHPKDNFAPTNEVVQARDFRGYGLVSQLGDQGFEFADQSWAANAHEGPRHQMDLVGRFTGALPHNAITASDPRGDLNEVPGFNGSIGSAQAIDRAGLSVTSDPNLYDASLPSLIIQGSVSTTSDEDFFSITLQAGELLVLDVDGTSGLDAHLRLYGPNGGTEIGDNDDYVIVDPGSETAATLTTDGHNTDSLIHFRATTAGTYYFSIESFVDPGNPTSGAYQLIVSVGPPGTAAQIAAEDILALQSGASWNHLALTYGFPTSASQYPLDPQGHVFSEVSGGKFSAFTAAQSGAATLLLQNIAAVTGLTFQQAGSPGQADIRYGKSTDADVAYAYYPTNDGPSSKGSTAWFNNSDFTAPAKGNYAWMGIVHETGHALGLKHGQEFPIALSADHDSLEFSVMTYRSYPGAPLTGYLNETWGYPQTLMMYDIAALQALYGANFSTNSGNSIYTWEPVTGEMRINGAGQGAPGNNRVFLTVWDGGGLDTYDLSNYGGGVSIDLNPGGWTTTSVVQLAHLGGGHFARGNVFNALQYGSDPRSLIENAIGGAGNDIIVGNAADNRLEGRGGNDELSGMGGNDAFYFTSDFNALDRVDGGAGSNDQIGLQGNYAGAGALTLGANTITGVELIAVLPGFTYDITTVDGNVPAGELLKVQATLLPTGQSLAFNGAAESDGSFIVYGGQGSDNFTGGGGNDGFYFGPGGFNSSDLINGSPGSNDQLALDGNYTITMGGNVSGIEVLVFLPGPVGLPNSFNVTIADSFVAPGQTMTIFGLQVSTSINLDGSGEQDAALRIYGGSVADTLTGSSNADWLFGGGGGDTLTGGSGADTFYYDDVAQSTGTGFDRLLGFDQNADRIDLPFAVAAFAGSASGALDASSMDTVLASAFAGLGDHQEGLFTATSGDLAGHVFAVVDANGVAGYQAGADYVIGILAPATPLDPGTSIFI